VRTVEQRLSMVAKEERRALCFVVEEVERGGEGLCALGEETCGEGVVGLTP
jgi:hypothetical protein